MDFRGLGLSELYVATFIWRIIYPAFVLVTAARLVVVSIRVLRSTQGAPRKIAGWIVAAAAGWVLITAMLAVMGYFFASEASDRRYVSYSTRPFGFDLVMLFVPVGYGCLSEWINGVLMDASREITSTDHQADGRRES